MSTRLALILLNPDGSTLKDPILDFGRTGVIVLREDYVVKLPLKYGPAGSTQSCPESFESENYIASQFLEHEKEVYRRLGKHDGIVRCLDLSGDGIQMALMTHGNLRKYLKNNDIAKSARLMWFRDMARTLVYMHECRVIVADIATRNFLLDSDLSVKMSDFTESSVMPIDLDMQTAEDSGYSIFTDMGQLGAVMYEVITQKPCEFDLFKIQALGSAVVTWPRRKRLPSTKGIWLGHIIQKCWTRER